MDGFWDIANSLHSGSSKRGLVNKAATKWMGMIINKSNPNSSGSSTSTFNVLAAIHYKQGNYSRSLNLLQEAIDALREIGLNDGPTAETIRKNMQVLRKKII